MKKTHEYKPIIDANYQDFYGKMASMTDEEKMDLEIQR